jgi:hypothetical protein
MNWQVMGLPEPWPRAREMFQNNCLMCHAAIRTHRHQVNYLNAAAIEKPRATEEWRCLLRLSRGPCLVSHRLPLPAPRLARHGPRPTPDWAKNRVD